MIDKKKLFLIITIPVSVTILAFLVIFYYIKSEKALRQKPVIITEFGYSTYHGGIGSDGLLSSSGLGGNIIDDKTLFLHQIPVLGRFVRPHTKGVHVRDEQWQARKLIENLSVLDNAGVDGTFIFEFISQFKPYDNNPKFDLDMASSSLVKYYEGGRHSATYPDMPWEPKESFKAVAEYYAKH